MDFLLENAARDFFPLGAEWYLSLGETACEFILLCIRLLARVFTVIFDTGIAVAVATFVLIDFGGSFDFVGLAFVGSIEDG